MRSPQATAAALDLLAWEELVVIAAMALYRAPFAKRQQALLAVKEACERVAHAEEALRAERRALRMKVAAADGAKVIAYVVREGQTKKRGAYLVTRSDEGGSELGSKSEAYRWPPERRAARNEDLTCSI